MNPSILSESPIKFKFAILIASFKAQQTPLDIYYNTEPPVTIPSLHVMGDTDKVIPKGNIYFYL